MGAIIGYIDTSKAESLVKDIIAGRSRLPLDNPKAMAYLQQRDANLQRVRALLQAGQRPSMKRDNRIVKTYFRSDVKTAINNDGCLVVNKTLCEFLGVKKQLIVVPEAFAIGLLHSLHIIFNHPTRDQLQKVVNTRFYILDIKNRCKKVTESCNLCVSLETIPKEIHDFKSNPVPDHPGQSFTMDVLKEAGKLVLAAVCNFSGYLSTSIIPSEKEADLRNGIISTVTPFMSSSLSRIRVDRAPGFNKLAKDKAALAELGIDLEQGEVKNKNACAIIDERMW